MDEELSLLDEINATIPASDFQAEYYPGGMVRITMLITAEVASQINALAQQQGWPEADAYVAMLATGIGALKEARARALQAENDDTARNELDLLVKQMRQMETQYAVMKFRTWNFLQAYQASAMSRGALENRAKGLAQVVDRLRMENDSLKEQLRQIESQGASPQQRPSEDPALAAEPAGGSLQRGSFLRRLVEQLFSRR